MTSLYPVTQGIPENCHNEVRNSRRTLYEKLIEIVRKNKIYMTRLSMSTRISSCKIIYGGALAETFGKYLAIHTNYS